MENTNELTNPGEGKRRFLSAPLVCVLILAHLILGGFFYVYFLRNTSYIISNDTVFFLYGHISGSYSFFYQLIILIFITFSFSLLISSTLVILLMRTKASWVTGMSGILLSFLLVFYGIMLKYGFGGASLLIYADETLYRLWLYINLYMIFYEIVCVVVSLKRRCKKNFVLMILALGLFVLNISVLYNWRSQKNTFDANIDNTWNGFAYMNGYSTVDFSDYMVYSENSKLVTLDTVPENQIENVEDMPVLDGAESCYPLYAAFAKAMYKDIDVIEKQYLEENPNADYNGKIVTFSNLRNAMKRLKSGEIDVLFIQQYPPTDAYPIRQSTPNGILFTGLECTPIAREAFVFYVSEKNPVDGLTTEQLQKIYTVDITYWDEVGGKVKKILPFCSSRSYDLENSMATFAGGRYYIEREKFRYLGNYVNTKNSIGFKTTGLF